jgi:hypothetical protein
MTDCLSSKHVFDRVFQRDDVALIVFVDVLHHRGQRAGFAAAGGPVTRMIPRSALAIFASVARANSAP